MTSPTARSLALLKKEGWTAKVVEHFNQFAGIRQDLWGMDILAIKAGNPGVLGIQATSTANISAREKKLLALPEVKIWLQANNSLEIWGWSKKGSRGKTKRWAMTKRIIS